MKRDETEKTVLNMAKKLRTYANAVHSPTHARIAALKTQVQELANKMEENHKELKQDILQISAVQSPEQQQAFAQIKQEIAHAVALGPVKTGPDMKNVLYSAARNNSLSWSLWQKVPKETQGRPLEFWSRSYRKSEANYTPTEKKILAAYEGVQAASEVVETETQLLLAPQLPVLG
ncbi:hypothetical protein DUI87_10513 [Hirundo rustica rustica]|uniref:Reverse transcriptase/retrotransposon-derived protein RNase H-like domain-containing protein n=1 Tax=Hirundo rustica rustica TaxID=333673 RepID=A0A3M0KNZ5_HIRRU|nr:hypothetical protein DUI87_10513 [Hirundo rustica rustica]